MLFSGKQRWNLPHFEINHFRASWFLFMPHSFTSQLAQQIGTYWCKPKLNQICMKIQTSFRWCNSHITISINSSRMQCLPHTYTYVCIFNNYLSRSSICNSNDQLQVILIPIQGIMCLNNDVWVFRCTGFLGSFKPLIIFHYSDVIMGAIASQITSPTIVYSTVYSGADQRKH